MDVGATRDSLDDIRYASPVAAGPNSTGTGTSASTTRENPTNDEQVAAWVANAIEPVGSPDASVCSLAASSTSTGGNSSDNCSIRFGLSAWKLKSLGLSRFRGLRVSIRRRRSKLRPVHHQAPRFLTSVQPTTTHLRRQLSPHYDPMFHQHLPQQGRRSSSAQSANRSSSLAFRSTTTRLSSDWRLSYDPSVSSTVPYTEVSPRGLELSDLEGPTSDDPTQNSKSQSHFQSQSRRSKAWKRLKSVRLRIKREKKATAMFSISFYPWKMEARGYYSIPEAAAEWVPDTASARCQICLVGFNLARRRHHCRLCGHLVCNDCSLQRTFLPFSEEAHRRSSHSLIKSGEAQRTCNSCANTLKNMSAQQDHRVKNFCVDVAAPPVVATHGRDSSCGYRASSSDINGQSAKTANDRHSYSASSAIRPAETQLQLQLQLPTARPRVVSKTAAARTEELEQVLQARTKSRSSATSTQLASASTTQHIINSQWLEQWLQFVQADSSDSVSHLSQSHMRASTMSRASFGSRRRSGRSIAFGSRPGPIANYALLNFVNGKLVPREGLRRSRGTEGTGDYHVISRDVWLVFLRLYGGGPDIRIDENATTASSSSNESSALVSAATSRRPAADTSSSRTQHWVITELDDAVSASQFAAASCSMKTTPLRRSASDGTKPRDNDDDQNLLAKSMATRPVSTTALTAPPALARATSEKHRHLTSDDFTQSRRLISSSFIGYWKKWRHGDDDALPPSATATTISHVDDEGVVLYDPMDQRGDDGYGQLNEVQHDEDDDEDEVYAEDFGSSRGPHQQRDTIAAVSAFAAAAAEARRKSTISLMRHSSLASMRSSNGTQPGVMSA